MCIAQPPLYKLREKQEKPTMLIQMKKEIVLFLKLVLTWYRVLFRDIKGLGEMDPELSFKDTTMNRKSYSCRLLSRRAKWQMQF